MNTATGTLDAAQVWSWLGDVPDPEIPVISVVDLGIVRAVEVTGNDACVVTITPTYSGCPAMQVIADAVTDALREHGVENVTLVNQLSPAWTTDWMTPAACDKLRQYGIAPPAPVVVDLHGRQEVKLHFKKLSVPVTPACPLCGSPNTELLSAFGSTSCKALYRCITCREPFDYFKPY